MTRPLYKFILWLHPPAFRRRFSDEMLSIFDEEPISHRAFGLLLDGLISLARQWLGHTDSWKVAIAIGAAFLQALWFASPRKGLHSWTNNRQPLTPYLQDLIVVTLVMIGGLFLMITSLALWTVRFQRRRSAGHIAILRCTEAALQRGFLSIYQGVHQAEDSHQ